MTTTFELEKSLLSPPGDTIQEHIDFVGMSQVELAERMGRPKEKINDLIKGREPITTTTAFKLEKVLGIPASFWLNREKTYRKELYELTQYDEFKSDEDWLAKFPVKALKKLGWLPDTREKYILVDNLLKFFGVASSQEWETIYVAEEVSVAFRVSLAKTKSPHAISTWLRIGELQLKDLEIKLFNKKKFKESLSLIKELAFLMPEDFDKQLQKLCLECGVAVVYTPKISKAPISGAARWFHNRPLIQLAGKFKTQKLFWFTFFHEAAHILLHGKKDIFLENVSGPTIDEEKENEANAFASKMLLSDYPLKESLYNDFKKAIDLC